MSERRPPAQPASARATRPLRLHVALRYHGPPLAGSPPPPGYLEADPLGTVEVRSAAEAKTRAAARWSDLPPRAVRVCTARRTAAGWLAHALALGHLAARPLSATAPRRSQR